jgi:hypothetical protein
MDEFQKILSTIIQNKNISVNIPFTNQGANTNQIISTPNTNNEDMYTKISTIHKRLNYPFLNSFSNLSDTLQQMCYLILLFIDKINNQINHTRDVCYINYTIYNNIIDIIYDVYYVNSILPHIKINNVWLIYYILHILCINDDKKYPYTNIPKVQRDTSTAENTLIKFDYPSQEIFNIIDSQLNAISNLQFNDYNISITKFNELITLIYSSGLSNIKLNCTNITSYINNIQNFNLN